MAIKKDKSVYRIALGESLVQFSDTLYFEHIVDVLFSKCTSKRYVSLWGKSNIAECLMRTFNSVPESTIIEVYNGMYTMKLPLGVLIENLVYNLSVWKLNDTFMVDDTSGESSVKVPETVSFEA